ncbi:hypothetical protein N0V90_000806 [Kalmusia sp. IMI 367209]|nr:hypothetical protein N0V90_000806 [Kalmusia sp. IMI 367209]
MARKDLLKRAFRNSFMRKSVADLKLPAAEKAHPEPRHASSTADLRTHYESTASSPDDITDAVVGDDNVDNQPANTTRYTESDQSDQVPCGSGVGEWLQSINEDHAMHMTSSEIRRQMDKYDVERKRKIFGGPTRRGNHGMSADYHALLFIAEEMAASHLDTIGTALTILEAMGALSPHTEALRQEMLEKKRRCCDKMEKLLQSRVNLEMGRVEL